MEIKVQTATPDQYAAIGKLMVDVYTQLEGFPSPAEQPNYYYLLRHVGDFASKGGQLLVATGADSLLGAVVYFNDLADYAAGGRITREPGAGFRLLAVAPQGRGKGIGTMLTKACIRLAKENGHDSLLIHTTAAMKAAWNMYEKMGFERYQKLDFEQQGFPVYGFRLDLNREVAD